MLAGWPGVNPRLMGGRPQHRFLGELVIAVSTGKSKPMLFT